MTKNNEKVVVSELTIEQIDVMRGEIRVSIEQNNAVLRQLDNIEKYIKGVDKFIEGGFISEPPKSINSSADKEGNK